MGFLRENLTVSDRDFWNGVKIYSEKPNSINKEVLFSELIVSFEFLFEVNDSECQLICDKFYNLIFTENKNVQEVVEVSRNFEKLKLINRKVLDDTHGNYLVLRKLQPKKPDNFDTEFYEIGFFDIRTNVARFYSLFDKSLLCECDTESGVRKFDPLMVAKYEKISICHRNDCFVVEYDDNLGEKGCNWLKYVFVKKLRKLIMPKNDNKPVPVMNFSNEINLVKYYQLYDKLKSKYAKDLVENWCEVTDAKKFVYEDIAISTYLLLLWNGGEIPDENSCKQKFIDLGCGNGLLVYILNSEGHEGIGLDLKKRLIWDTYPSNVILKQEAVVPGPRSVYPGADWLIGNHSDELTPWVPIMARRSGVQCQFFLLPCCPYDLNGQIYQRKNSSLSAYHDYVNYVIKITEICEFETFVDRLRIPSTRKICIVGRKKDISPEKLLLIDEEIDHFIARVPFSNDTDIYESVDFDEENWIRGFKVRQTTEPIRNCTRLPKDLIDEIVSIIANNLLKETNLVKIQRDNVTSEWNQGGRIHLSKLATLLSFDQLKYLKNECKGLQTLIKNHHYVFNVNKGMVRLRNVEEMFKISKNVLKNYSSYKWKQKDCWFHRNHPHGCPLPDRVCSYSHESRLI